MKPKKTTKEEVKTEEVTPEVAEETKETPAGVDYRKYASMAETPQKKEYRVYNSISVYGSPITEIVKDKDGNELEKRKPPIAIKLLRENGKNEDGRYESEELQLPLTVVPIKYRTILEQKGGDQNSKLLALSSEYNGNLSDKVVITKFKTDTSGKTRAYEKVGPMTVGQALKSEEFMVDGKTALKSKALVYALYKGELVVLVVKSSSLWEQRKKIAKFGKTEASRTLYPYLTEYFQTFQMNDPYFLYEMKVDAAYRDHGASKYYRSIFEKGARINAETEKVVLETLEDLHKYFTEQDKQVAEFVPTASAAAVPTEHVDGEEHVEDVGF